MGQLEKQTVSEPVIGFAGAVKGGDVDQNWIGRFTFVASVEFVGLGTRQPV